VSKIKKERETLPVEGLRAANGVVVVRWAGSLVARAKSWSRDCQDHAIPKMVIAL
jgi:hypothetical protein